MRKKELAERIKRTPARSIIIAVFVFILFFPFFVIDSPPISEIIVIVMSLVMIAFIWPLPSQNKGDESEYCCDELTYYGMSSSDESDNVSNYSSGTTYVSPHMRTIQEFRNEIQTGEDEYFVPTHETHVSGHFRNK